MFGIKRITSQRFFPFFNAMSYYFNEVTLFENYTNTLENNIGRFFRGKMYMDII